MVWYHGTTPRFSIRFEMASRDTIYRLKRLLGGHTFSRKRGTNQRAWVCDLGGYDSALALTTLGPLLVAKRMEYEVSKECAQMLLSRTPGTRYSVEEKEVLAKTRRALLGIRKGRRVRAGQER